LDKCKPWPPMLGEMGGIGCSRVAQTVTQTGCVVVWWGERERGRCGYGREGEEAHPSQSPPCQTFSFPSWKRCPSHWDLKGCGGVRVCVAVSERQEALSGKWWQAAVQREEKSASVSTPNDEIGEGRLACAKQEWHVFLHCSTLHSPHDGKRGRGTHVCTRRWLQTAKKKFVGGQRLGVARVSWKGAFEAVAPPHSHTHQHTSSPHNSFWRLQGATSRLAQG
jgi:hypothetical protein